MTKIDLKNLKKRSFASESIVVGNEKSSQNERQEKLPSKQNIKTQPTLLQQPSSKKVISPSPFFERDTLGSVQQIFDEVQQKKRKDLQARKFHGLRRVFRVSFGPNDELVIPNLDGSIEIKGKTGLPRTIQKKQIESEFQLFQESKGVEEYRIQAYWNNTTIHNERRIVWQLIDALYGNTYRCHSITPNTTFTNRIEQRQQEINLVRIEGLDCWLRTVRIPDSSKNGLQYGRGDLERKKAKSLDELRAATISSQAPGIGMELVSILKTSQEENDANNNKKQHSTTDIHRVIGIVTGTKIQKLCVDEQDWLKEFSLRFWYRDCPLDPLAKVLHELTTTNSVFKTDDGIFRFLHYASNPTQENLIKSLLSLRNENEDWSLSWEVSQLFPITNQRKKYRLGMNFAHQLHLMGLFRLSLQVIRTLFNTTSNRMKVIEKKAIQYYKSINIDKMEKTIQDRVEVIDFSFCSTLKQTYFSNNNNNNNQVLVKGWFSAKELGICYSLFGQEYGPSLILNEKFEEFLEYIDIFSKAQQQQQQDVKIELELWNSNALFWLDLMTEYVKLRMEIFENRIISTLSLLHNFKLFLHFPIKSLANECIVSIANWLCEQISFLFRNQLILSRQELAACLNLPISEDHRKIFIKRHVSDLTL